MNTAAGPPNGPADQAGGAASPTSNVIRRISRSTTIALLLSPVGLLLIAATRLLIVSNYNPATALAITSSQGYINTLLGTIIPIIPIYMPYLALLLLFSGRIIPSMLAFLATALISPISKSQSDTLNIVKKDWHLIFIGSGAGRYILLVFIAVLFACLLAAELAGFGFTVLIRTCGTVASLALLPLMVGLYPLPINNSVYTNLVKQPWLPAETITLTSRQDVIGYVLSSDGYWLEVLMADNRTIRYYRMSDITEREICQTNKGAPTRPLIALVPADVTIPQCPQPSTGAKAMPNWLLPILIIRSGAGATGNMCTMPVPAVCQQSSRKLRE